MLIRFPLEVEMTRHVNDAPDNVPERESSDSAWYAPGLAFECTRCGACCTGEPGFVWVDHPEIERLARSLDLTVDEFGSRYLRQVLGRISLIERPNGDCVFWDRQAGCTVYGVRPTQCRTWPFWDENVASPEDWRETQAVCPGAGQGPVYSAEEIRWAVSRTRP